jgi:hypothetical protein
MRIFMEKFFSLSSVTVKIKFVAEFSNFFVGFEYCSAKKGFRVQDLERTNLHASLLHLRSIYHSLLNSQKYQKYDNSTLS